MRKEIMAEKKKEIKTFWTALSRCVKDWYKLTLTQADIGRFKWLFWDHLEDLSTNKSLGKQSSKSVQYMKPCLSYQKKKKKNQNQIASKNK